MAYEQFRPKTRDAYYIYILRIRSIDHSLMTSNPCIIELIPTPLANLYLTLLYVHGFIYLLSRQGWTIIVRTKYYYKCLFTRSFTWIKLSVAEFLVPVRKTA